MANTVTPAAIARADYPIAQTPSLGGEVQAYATAYPAGLIKSVRKISASEYDERIYSSSAFDSTNGVNVVVVGTMGLTGAISGVIEVPDWSPTKSTYFQTGKAGEGSLTSPYNWGVRGEELLQLEIPQFNPTADAADRIWNEIGAVTDRKLKIPSRKSKNIAEGLESARWAKPGMTTIGEFSITANNMGHEEGLLKLAGRKVHIMLRIMNERVVETSRVFILNWSPEIDRSDPEGEGESTVTATGIFSHLAFISAPGTPA